MKLLKEDDMNRIPSYARALGLFVAGAYWVASHGFGAAAVMPAPAAAPVASKGD